MTSSPPQQIDDVIDEIISLESSYEELLSFGEGGAQLPSTVRRPRPHGLGGGGASRNHAPFP